MIPYFENIDERLVEQLNLATDNIKVAVAWISDPKLIKTLAFKAMQGVKVEIIVSAKPFSENFKRNQDLAFRVLFMNKCKIYKIGSSYNDFSPLMHNKFCIIDNNVIITGSYNWTVKAPKNQENIIIIKDSKVAKQYVDKFEEIKQGVHQNILWFNELDIRWQERIKEILSLSSEPTDKEIEGLLRLSEIDISDAPFSMREMWVEDRLDNLIGKGEISNNDINFYKSIFLDEVRSISDLSPLSYFKELKALNCSGTDVKSLKPISNLIKLEKLDIGGIECIELDFEHLKELTNLKSLSCGHLKIKNFEAIRFLKNLEEICFSYGVITKNDDIQSLEPLRNLKKLKILDISGLQVSNIEPLSDLIDLEIFRAEYTNVKDLSILFRLPKLKIVDVFTAPVDEHELNKLKKRLAV
ncbi:phospholipase D-like domain-containing protein [Cytophagaceae bacterium ABcell3]|nr:phospholipase D-like domain-containing protein [Cytophagaceae bacterium ABcell3]